MSPATDRQADVYVLATLDTKGEEAAFVAAALRAQALSVQVVDVGCLGEPAFVAEVSREQVMEAGGGSLAALARANDRGQAVKAAAAGAATLVRRAGEAGRVAGVIALGGSAGTTIGSAAMRELPLGIPKVMVSTLASGNCRPYVGAKDIAMFHSVVDIAGVNRISRIVLHNAAMALAGMAAHPTPASPEDKPLVAASMFGVTTPCVEQARQRLEEAGYEVLVFHATGSGGQAMESLIREGLVDGVLDLTTTELADELVGGVLSAGPDRLSAAVECGVPQVVSVGATDMVNFGPRDSVPSQFSDRQFYEHNATVTLMRTTREECQRLGDLIGGKLRDAPDTVILLPAWGVSAIDAAGQVFDAPESREALFEAVAANCGETPVERLACHINDTEFATAAAERLLTLMKRRARRNDSNE